MKLEKYGCSPLFCHAGNYTNFSVAVYIQINVVQSFDQPGKLQADYDCIHRQLKFDKVYIEVQRDRRLLSDEQAERTKKFFLVRAEANGNGFPLLLLNRYSKGVLYVWTMPDNFTDLYALPPEVTTAIKNYLMRGFPVRLDGPAQIALFVYDNGAFIVQNFSATAADVKISTLGNSSRLKNLVTSETLEGKLPPRRGLNWRNEDIEDRVAFSTQLPPHSYAVFTMDKTAQASAH